MLMPMVENPADPDEPIDSKFGTRLRRYRNAKGLSLADLAESSKMKEGTIRQIELNNTGIPTFVNGLKLAAALGISPYELADVSGPGFKQSVEHDRDHEHVPKSVLGEVRSALATMGARMDRFESLLATLEQKAESPPAPTVPRAERVRK